MNENEREDRSAEGGSGSGSGVGWHTRALTRIKQGDSKSAAAPSSFDPGASDLVFLLCVQSKGTGDGFACALVNIARSVVDNDDTITVGAGEGKDEEEEHNSEPGVVQSHHLRHVVAVDAFGRVLELNKEDYEVFEREMRAVKELPKPQEFMGQWRVKRAITCLPFYKVDIFPGGRSSSSKRVEEGEEIEDKVTATVYGWNANTDELERETVGRTRLPGSLQRLIGLGMEGRDGYNRTIERDEEVIGKVMALGGFK
ncbi:hypothetical protein FRB91_005840 [Serendipita sp. 411]|nr:hypothetical protein FRB91_005840 [Serendipita sp. 411]